MMATVMERGRRRGLAVLLADTFMMFGGFFMLVPLISIHYVEGLGFAAAAVGFALAVRQLTQQGLTLFGGALADRWGAKWLICAGMLLRSAGFAGLAWADTFLTLLLMCVLAALGGALFEAPRSAAIAALTDPASRARFFSLTGVVGGLGMTIGPLVGAVLVASSWTLVCFVSALCFGVGALVTALLLPPIAVAAESQPIWRGIGLAARDRLFVVFTLLLAGYWFMWVQLSISLPLAAQRFAPLEVTTSLGTLRIGGGASVYAVNAGLTVVLQYPVLAIAGRFLRPLPIITLGAALMAAGLAAIALASGMAALLSCIAVFALGAMLIQPVQQQITAEMAEPASLGSYFGFSALALAFGGGLGNFAGGWLYDLAREWTLPALPWLVFGAAGGIVVVGLLALDRVRGRTEAATAGRRATP